MIIINDTTYIMDPTDVSTVTAMSNKILVRFKGQRGFHSVPSDNPKEDARRLVNLLSIDIKAGGSPGGLASGLPDPRVFNTTLPTP